ncbi:MAG: MFS transporter [Armatimonadetes bacterium]|nr:MFS transporter [Armatimonadota bacterium]
MNAHPHAGLGRAFITIWLVSLATYLSFQLLTASLPLYAVGLGASDASVGMLSGLIATVALIARPMVGWWVDRGGSAWAMISGTGLFTVAAVGYWMASSVAVILLFRAVNGLGIALFHTAGQTVVANLAPVERRGEALSLFSISHSLSQGLGPPIGVAVVQAAGYPSLFAICVTIGLIGVVLALPLRTLRTAPASLTRHRFFHRGVLLPGLLMTGLTVTFGATVGLLAVHASRRGLPNPGLVFTAYAAGIFLAQSVAGRISDRRGRMAVIAPGMILAALGMWATASAGGWWLIAAGVLAGMGLGSSQPSLFALAADMVPVEERGSAMATMGVFLEIGIGTGAIGGGLVGRAFGLGVTYGLAGVPPALAAMVALGRLRAQRTQTRMVLDSR